MKKTFALLLVCALLLCLAACGNGGAESVETAAETASVPELTTAATDATTGDAALIGEIKAQLVGDWKYNGFDGVKLTFRNNGTGSYLGLDGSERSFLYLVTVAHETYANGAEYINNVLNISYDTGKSEEIAVDFPEEDGTKLILHSLEENGYTGGYSGLIDFDEWTKDS